MPVGATVKGLDGFQKKVGNFSRKAPLADTKIVGTVALSAKGILLAHANPRRLGRFNRGRGVNLNVSYRLKPGKHPVAFVMPTPPGPWYMLEYGGKAHQIGRRNARRGGRRGQPGFLGDSGRGFAAVGPVDHPAFAARHTWSAGAKVAVASGRAQYQRAAGRTYMGLLR